MVNFEAQSPKTTDAKVVAFTRVSFFIILASSILFFIIDSCLSKYVLRFTVGACRDLNDYNEAVITIIFFLCSSLLGAIGFPLTILNVLSGFIFAKIYGFYIGALLISSIITTISFTNSSLLTFFFVRIIYSDVVKEWIQASDIKVLQGLEGAILKNGLYVNFLLRLCPLMPAWVVNYGAPAMGSNIWAYLYAALLGNIPHCIILSAAGGCLNKINNINDYLHHTPKSIVYTVIITSVLLLIVSIWFLYVFTMNAIDNLSESESKLKEKCDDNNHNNNSNNGNGIEEDVRGVIVTERTPLISNDDNYETFENKE
eukprot:gene7467-15279_t